MWQGTERLWMWLGRRYYEDLASRGIFKIQAWSECYMKARKEVLSDLKHAGATHLSGTSTWQHDHIRPLVEAHGDLAYWKMENVQTLCSACHIEKGREDNARRRALKHPGVQMALL